MTSFSHRPYKKAILFEQLYHTHTHATQTGDPLAAHWIDQPARDQAHGINKRLLVIGSVIALHVAVFYLAKQWPTPPLVLKKPQPVVVEMVKPEPPKIIQPKIPPVSPQPEPVQKQVVEKPAVQQPVQKQVQQPKSVAQATEQPMVQPALATEKTLPTPAPAPKAVETLRQPSHDNLPLTEAKGYAGYLSNPAPEYPDLALDRGWEGVVILRVKVSSTGSPIEINIKNGSGKKVLDDAAVRTVKRWTFSPAMRGTTAVEGWVDVPIHFKLPT